MPERPSRPLLMATLVEAVLQAGRLQIEGVGRAVVSKKSAIDLVTDVDVAIERGFRAMLTDRFPAHRVLGEELENEREASTDGYCWVFDPIDGTTNYGAWPPVLLCLTGPGT